jgi:hypothetical protein
VKKKKRPRAAFEPSGLKRPSTGGIDPDSAADRYMAWRLSHVDMDGDWGWGNLASHHVEALHVKLVDIEALTLGELMARRGTKQVSVENLPSPAQKRLQAIRRDDVDELWELRFTGTQRIWGVIQGSIFYFLWWDPDHTVYPSHKKHT